MSSRNTPPRLGRGLAALLGEAPLRPEAEGPTSISTIPIDQIDANPFQPRSDFNSEELQSLADSIRVQGVLQPIMARRHPTNPDRFQIIAGERRFRAATLAGLVEIPAIVRDLNDSDAAVVALVENLQRQDLNAIEEAEGYQRLLQDFGLTHEALGYAVSKSRSHIGNVIRLLRLPDPIKREVRAGALSFGHARALINAPHPEVLTEQVVKRGLSVRQTEALVAKALLPEKQRQPKVVRLDIADIEHRVTDIVGCRVTITTNNSGGGDLTLRFSDMFQLEELIERLTARPEKSEPEDAPSQD
jgi:ParB family chromosome partitioning protein